MQTNRFLAGVGITAVVLTLLMVALRANATEHMEPVAFGDFETWTVRYIKESALLGGQTKTLYMVAPTDTVFGTRYTRSDSPWSSGNAFAQALGVNKVSVSVTPERRGNGYCCRMETRLDTVRAAGINLKALVTGSLYTGVLADPVTLAHSSDPNSAIDMGVPFTGHPKALVLDYKAHIEDGDILQANATTKVKHLPGHDKGQIVFILQHRWEENGHVYAYRVGTATEYISESTDGWVNNHRLEVFYCDSPTDCNRPWHDLSNHRFKTHNSKGKMVLIEEVGWRGDLQPTHMVIQISSGSQLPFTGCPGNVVWCDNIRLAYDD